MLVTDTSVFIDYFFERDEKKRKAWAQLIKLLEGLIIYVPKVISGERA